MFQRHAIDAHSPSCRSPLAALLPVMAAVFIAFLIIGLALPVLPLHVHYGLGLSMFVVGLVTGSQFAAAIISRVWAGNFADTRGAKQAVVIGLGTCRCVRALLSPIACIHAYPGGFGQHAPVGPGGARRRRELDHHGRGYVGARHPRSRTGRSRHSLDGYGDVRRVRRWRRPRYVALRRRWLFCRGPGNYTVPIVTLLLVAPLSPVLPSPPSGPAGPHQGGARACRMRASARQ